MMCSASEVAPTPMISSPRGRWPREAMKSCSPTIQMQAPPARWVPRRSVRGKEALRSAHKMRPWKKPETKRGWGGGSVAPMTTARASPLWMASKASLRHTPKVEQAATGAHAGPVMRPSMEICEAGVLGMFQTRFADTARQGGVGQAQRCSSRDR